MNSREIKKEVIETIIITLLTVLAIYFFKNTGINFNYSFDFSKARDLMNISILENLALSLVLISLTIFSINYFARGEIKKERAGVITISLFLSSLICFFWLGLSSIALSMIGFYWISLFILSLKTHKKPKNAFEKMGVGWSHAKLVVLILAIGGFIIGLYFTNQNLPAYQETVKNSVVSISLSASKQFMPSGESLTPQMIENSKQLFNNLIQQMPLFQSFLGMLPLITGIMLGSIILFIGDITLPIITAIICLFLRTEKEPKVELKAKKGLFDNVPLEEEQEKQQQ